MLKPCKFLYELGVFGWKHIAVGVKGIHGTVHGLHLAENSKQKILPAPRVKESLGFVTRRPMASSAKRVTLLKISITQNVEWQHFPPNFRSGVVGGAALLLPSCGRKHVLRVRKKKICNSEHVTASANDA